VAGRLGGRHHGEGGVDAGGGVAFGIFQFGFRQGGLGAGAPVDGLEAPIDVALQVHLAEHGDLSRFVLGLQGHVGGSQSPQTP
jgi:hypothetical protein